ncbi:arylesterase [Pseudophaeobacter arcticus]|jgi:acyl-CoA thioesterase-1|uniref:arylesterase n=1 Tax=Pseudophaeobacter arcticus TaxID=385492 RepID=UPI0039E683B7
MRKVLALFGIIIVATLASGSRAEELRITALGDSLVQGYGLPQGDGLVPQLQNWLQEQGAEVRLTNAGVSGDTTAGGAARIDWTLADQPQGLIVLLGGNDLLRGLPPLQARANLRQILLAAQAREVEVLLIGMQAPGNFGPEYKASFDSIYAELAQEFGALLHADAFAGIRAVAGHDPAAAQAYMQEDNIHPNARGVALNVAALGPVVLELAARIEAAAGDS